MLPTDRLTIILTMACLSSSNRVCARVVQEKLCQFVAVGKNQPLVAASGSNAGGSGGGGIGSGTGSNGKQTVGGNRQCVGIAGSAAVGQQKKSGHYPLFTSGSGSGNFVRGIGNNSFGVVESFKYGPSAAAAGLGLGIGSVRNFYSSSLVRNLFQKNQPSSTAQILPPVTHPCMRGYSSVHTQQPAGPIREYNIDPYILLDEELKYIFEDIRAYDWINILNNVVHAQRQIAMISEMIHTASLVHDDVIDQSFARRGKPSVNVIWNHKKVTQAGDYVLAIASMLLARLKHDEVTHILSQVLTDLVQGEFMQLGSKETENERFAHYFTKTYRKTASLIANSLKAVAVLSGADEQMVELSFQYGRNLGLAFQFVDDLLDFVSSSEAMGKPAAADLKLGLATAPVLFACEKFPELNPMILRRFREPGDVERAYELVHKSQGLEQTRFLARKHCIEALRLASQISESPYQKGLIVVGDFVLNRMK
ncbi:all trans-polyprenyl-diphosphate synthase PDSS1 [Culex quinquefasciatus]|uniref:all trans-polyprenyl-diphosphate synthase PDSS1 n=1 Tax=Culex quinquefasciatus TaxID=7176 RepID=UPI0018E399D3|nr:all trans-polyprenyl-diphosphate synthase PDSS1 [Culex quinquefasciatus]